MSGSGETFGRTLITLAQIVFSLLFPFLAISVCGLAYVLTFVLHIPQFALLAFLAHLAIEHAQTHRGAALAMWTLAFGSVYLAGIAYREHETRASAVVGSWVGALIWCGGTFALVRAWAFDGSNIQQLVFAFLLFGSWAGVCEAVIDAAKLNQQNRPKPGPGIVEAQKAHGDARVASEAEAHSLLNPKK
ncbi:MAG TPA: hypothetical protein VMF32_17200 [Xanthobacteraceae bacterium]|nr:hypothetical protein [Xanthobacteraceae bacterium]